jgi:hypothetical protein
LIITTPLIITKRFFPLPLNPFADSFNSINKGVYKTIYNISMPAERLPQPQITPLATALRRLELCAYAVQEIHMELDAPQDPDSKADLILATEKLVSETFDLYQTVRTYVWGDEEQEEEI